jgi:hypothetical protein
LKARLNWLKMEYNNETFVNTIFCALVVRVPGYRSRGTRFDSQRYQIF